MSLLAVLPLVIAGLLGGLLPSLLLPLPGGRAATALRFSAGTGLGFALVSAWTFLAFPVLGGVGAGLIALETGVVLVLVFLVWRARVAVPRVARAPWSPTERALCVLFLLAAASCATAFALRSVSEPHGAWDAWAIWNERARFLFRAGAEWRRAFAPDLLWSHPDYPLLLPCLVVRGWAYVGAESPWVPALVGLAYTLATAALLVSCLTLLWGRSAALVAGCLLLSTPLVWLQAAAQCADVPLAFYFLGALAFFALEGAFPEHARALALVSGTLAGCSAWTKNEGILFLACFACVRVALALRSRAPTARARLGRFVLGALPAVVLIAVFRLSLHLATDLVYEQSPEHVVASLLDPHRHASVLVACVRVLRERFLAVLVVAAACLLLLGRAPRTGPRAPAGGPATVLALLSAGYFVVYVTTPKPFTWHLDSSLHRLALQLWPSVLLCTFLLAGRRDPD